MANIKIPRMLDELIALEQIRHEAQEVLYSFYAAKNLAQTGSRLQISIEMLGEALDEYNKNYLS